MEVSIIIRTKNEERWITACLKSVFSQKYNDFEVILVDNQSTDKTIEKAKAFDIKILEIEAFLPGKALNMGIRQTSGKFVVCLSGHCIPVNENWLGSLIRNFDDPQIAGVYGRQEPLSFSSDFDKRDMAIVFGLDRKVQKKDPFFHNANSAIRRDIWEKIPFDEEVTNIEDRVWANDILSKGYSIIYEPEASVYHYHGIHQDLDRERARKVVSIIESLDNNKQANLNAQELNIIALIPIKGEVVYCGKKPLLEYTIHHALESEFVDRVIVSTDNEELAHIARKSGAEVPFLRPNQYSLEQVGLEEVIRYSLDQLETLHLLPDLIVLMEATYPFRPKGLIDQLIQKLLEEGLDSVLSVKKECRTLWIHERDETKMLGDGFIPRQFKQNETFISLLGLGAVTHPHFIRQGHLLGNKIGIIEVNHSLAHLEIRHNDDNIYNEKLIEEWCKTQS